MWLLFIYHYDLAGSVGALMMVAEQNTRFAEFINEVMR